MRKREKLEDAAKAIGTSVDTLAAYKQLGCPSITQTGADVIQVCGWVLRRLGVEFHAVHSGDAALAHMSRRDEQTIATDILAVTRQMGEYIVLNQKR